MMRSPPSQAVHGLPRFLTSFVGREDKIREITGLLMRDEVRLLTLLGPGGAGKSRLAVETVARLDDDAFDTTWYLPLVAVRDPALVLPTIAQALGLELVAGLAVNAAIVQFLVNRRALLVIDNLEHLIECAPDLGHILAACPDLTMLVTSRVALRISAEHLMVVHPMGTPASSDIPLDQLRGIEAVQLFTERASARDSAFAVTPGNAPAISRICQRLDGLPLAIELAAARCNTLSPPALDALLDQGSGLLSDGPRDAPERHRSMHDTIAWSYNLLPEQEQAVFRQLAVFRGGFSLAAANAVVDVPVNVLSTISSLTDASLVVAVQTDRAEPRFTMLETLCEFALGRLEAAGDAAATRDRHARFFAEEARECHYAWVQPLEQGLRQLTLLEADLANMRAALEWLDHSKERATCLQMSADLSPLWILRGHMDEGHAWLERLLADPQVDDIPIRAHALSALAWLSNDRGAFEKGFELANEGISILQGLDEPLLLMACLGLSGASASGLGDVGIARERTEATLRVANTVSGPAWLANWIQLPLVHLGHLDLEQGFVEEAERRFMECVDLQIARGYKPGYSCIRGSNVLSGLGHIALRKGRHAEALRYFQQFLERAWQCGTVSITIRAIIETASALVLLGQYELAAQLLGATEALQESYSYHFVPSIDIRQAVLQVNQDDVPLDASIPWQTVLQTKWRERHPASRQPNPIDTAWTRGRALSLEAAVTEALSATVEPEPSAATSAAAGLTPRETEVLQLVTEGHSNRAIANMLFVSERTVEHHMRHILAKLDMGSRAAAAAYAVRNNLV